MSFKIDIKGLTEVIAKLDALPADLKKRMNGQMTRGARVFVRNAQRDAPVDFGRLKGGISFRPNPVSNLAVEMVSSAEYSPYPEFGTITFAAAGVAAAAETSGQIGVEAYALQFKGKGIRKSGGMLPRPYFFKQLPFTVKTIETGMQAELNGMKL